METTKGANTWLMPASIVLAGLFIGGAVLWNNIHPATTGGGPGGDTGTQPTVNIKDVDTKGAPFIGDASAPVTIAFWADYQCPYCKQFEQVTLPQIIQNYVSTGKVKVVFLDLTFLGEDSVTAAAYSHAVWKLYPEQYFAWRTAMYTAQDDEGDKGFGDAASIDKLNATVPGIDAAKVKADVATNKAAYDAIAEDNKAQGQKFGINATPSFVIGKQLIQGALPFDAFKAALDPLVK